MEETLQYFLSYPVNHPFRELVTKGFDEKLTPRLPEGISALNLLQPLIQVLRRLRMICPTAYNSMVKEKLGARKGKNDFDAHNLISALCELSVMNAFISSSGQPESFLYEPILVDGTNKNVEFSIIVGGIRFNVEVKSANMIKEAKAIERGVFENGQTIEPNERMIPYEEWKKIAGDTPLMGSLDNKVKDFLEDSQKKFPVVDSSINLLVVCWDGRYRKALSALKSETSGLLTKNTYVPDLVYDHISHIIVTSQYGFLINWLQGEVPTLYAQDPINMRFAYNFLIDYNSNIPEGIQQLFQGILGCQELPVVDEEYVKQCCEAVSFSLNL